MNRWSESPLIPLNIIKFRPVINVRMKHPQAGATNDRGRVRTRIRWSH
jgi:hypothetical protein